MTKRSLLSRDAIGGILFSFAYLRFCTTTIAIEHEYGCDAASIQSCAVVTIGCRCRLHLCNRAISSDAASIESRFSIDTVVVPTESDKRAIDAYSFRGLSI